VPLRWRHAVINLEPSIAISRQIGAVGDLGHAFKDRPRPRPLSELREGVKERSATDAERGNEQEEEEGELSATEQGEDSDPEPPANADKLPAVDAQESSSEACSAEP